jgi:hypothetical protein
MRDTILSMAPSSTATALEDSESAQSQALSWLESQGSLSELQLRQRFALATLAFEAASDQWDSSAGWLSNDDECTWYGVSCTNGQVQAIELRDNSIGGSFPPELAMLTGLVTLDVGENEIGGTLNVRGLSNLQSLLVDNNRFRGEILDDLVDLTDLRIVDLQYNDFDGSVPWDLGNLVNLQELLFWATEITGTIPDAVCELDSLQDLQHDCYKVNSDCYTRCYYLCGGDTGISCGSG